MRRSVAQKFIKHFIVLGVDSFVIADVMLYNIEIAQTYSSENTVKQELFFKSMFNSWQQAIEFTVSNGIYHDFKLRIEAVYFEVGKQKWLNQSEFDRIMDRLE
jgi:hypothetical protein